MTSTPARLPLATAIVAAALLLAVWSAIPLAVWWDGVAPDYFAGAWQAWGWGSALAGLIVVLVLAVSKGRVPAVLLSAWRGMMSMPRAVFLTGAAVMLALLTLLCCWFVFDGNPRNVDGFAQLFQARIFLAGRLWNASPAELANFGTLQMILGPDKWLSQYPPGQSVVLAIGLLAGKWWLLNPLIAVVFALATYRVARWCADESVARLTLLLLCVSPFVVAVAGSEMSHLAAAALCMGAAALAIMATERTVYAVGCGLLLGLETSFRPLDAVAATVPCGIILLAWAPQRARAIAAATIGGILGAAPILWFNALANGSPTAFGYTTLWGPQHALGFHPVPWGVPLTLTRAIARSGMDLHQLNVYLFDSTLPVLLVVAAGFVAGRKLIVSRDAILFVATLSLIALLFFYWHRDVFYGPRFLYSVVGWFVILLARALVLLRRSWTAEDGRGFGLTASFTVLVSIAFGLVALTPTRIRAYRDSTPGFALHPDRDAARENIARAVVVIPDGWGSRLIARMWQQGIPVRRSSRIYAAIDACTLEEALLASERDSSARDHLLVTLDSLASLGRPGARVRLTFDQNLRLPEGAPPRAACLAEIEVDRRGYYSYAPYLWLNNANLDGDIVWARDLGPGNAALFTRYAGRRFYRYVPVAVSGPPSTQHPAPSTRRPTFIPITSPGW